MDSMILGVGTLILQPSVPPHPCLPPAAEPQGHKATRSPCNPTSCRCQSGFLNNLFNFTAQPAVVQKQLCCQRHLREAQLPRGSKSPLARGLLSAAALGRAAPSVWV